MLDPGIPGTGTISHAAGRNRSLRAICKGSVRRPPQMRKPEATTAPMRQKYALQTIAAVLLTSSAATARAEQGPSEIDVSPYERNIATIERDGGALDYRLSEQFLSVGLAYRANGETGEAIEAFQQALHVNRINKGLHHLVHIPIVDLLIETYATVGDWQAVDQHQRFRFWIHRREVDAHSDEFVDAAMTFAAWETRAHDLDTGVATYRKLRDAIEALDDALGTISDRGTEDDPRLVRILNSQAQAHLNLAMYVGNTEEDIATGGQRMGEDFGDIIERRNLIIESFISGKQALERVVALTNNPEQEIEHGLALANLADWELVFDRPQSSDENYRDAYRMLKAAGLSEDELALEFGTPRAMKYFSVERRSPIPENDTAPANAYVAASFKVTKSGKVRSIEVTAANPPDNTRMLREARATLRNSRFRPSIGDDGPFEDAMTIRYVFPDVSI